jgi:hypothetical protein
MYIVGEIWLGIETRSNALVAPPNCACSRLHRLTYLYLLSNTSLPVAKTALPHGKSTQPPCLTITRASSTCSYLGIPNPSYKLALACMAPWLSVPAFSLTQVQPASAFDQGDAGCRNNFTRSTTKAVVAHGVLGRLTAIWREANSGVYMLSDELHLSTADIAAFQVMVAAHVRSNQGYNCPRVLFHMPDAVVETTGSIGGTWHGQTLKCHVESMLGRNLHV